MAKDQEPQEPANVENETDSEPAPAYAVHIYEHGKFVRTIERDFTVDEAEAFVDVYDASSKHYHRRAIATAPGVKPPQNLT